MAALQQILIVSLLAVAAECFWPWLENGFTSPGYRHLKLDDFFRDGGPFGPSGINDQNNHYGYQENHRHHDDNFYPSHFDSNETPWLNKIPRNPFENSMYYGPSDPSFRPGDCGNGPSAGNDDDSQKFGDSKTVDDDADEDLKIDPRKDKEENTETNI